MTLLEFIIELLQAAAIIILSRGVRANAEAIAKARKENAERHPW